MKVDRLSLERILSLYCTKVEQLIESSVCIGYDHKDLIWSWLWHQNTYQVQKILSTNSFIKWKMNLIWFHWSNNDKLMTNVHLCILIYTLNDLYSHLQCFRQNCSTSKMNILKATLTYLEENLLSKSISARCLILALIVNPINS